MPPIDPQGTPDPATPPAPEAVAGAQQGAPAPDVPPDSSPATPDVTPAAPSAADGVDEKQALLEVTRSALAASKPVDPPASPAGNGPSPAKADSGAPTTPETPPTAPAPADDVDDDFKDANTLDFGKHPRFQKLLKQWNRDRAAATSHRQVEDFMRQNGVPPNAAANALKLAALLQHAQRGSVDHAKLFLKDVLPQVTRLRQLVGDEIAPDVQDKLNQGAVDEPTAKELTQARARATAAEEAERERAEQEQSNNRIALQNTMRSAVSEWEAGIRVKDDAYPRKSKLVTATAVALARENPPKTAQEAVALAQAAYKQVNEAFDGLAPAGQQPTPPVPPRPSDSSTPRTVIAQPKTPLEITRAALASMNQ